MRVRNKYNITIDASSEKEVLNAGFKYSKSDKILWLGNGVEINTHYRLDNILGEDYSYTLHYNNAISFDEPETVISALNLFLMNCTIGYLHEY